MRTRLAFFVVISAALTVTYGCKRADDCVGADCATSDGGDDGAGGAPGVGGSAGMGGTQSAGGAPGMGGAPGAGGEPGMGGQNGGTPGAGGAPGMGGDPGSGGMMEGPPIDRICRVACTILGQCNLPYTVGGEPLTRQICSNLCPDGLESGEPVWTQFVECMEPLAQTGNCLRQRFLECTGQEQAQACEIDRECGEGQACHNEVCEEIPADYCPRMCELQAECGQFPPDAVEDCMLACDQQPPETDRWRLRDYYCTVDTLMPPDACSEPRLFSCMESEACDGSNPCPNGNPCVEFSCGAGGVGGPPDLGTCRAPIILDPGSNHGGRTSPEFPSEHASPDRACGGGTGDAPEQVYLFAPGNTREHCIRVEADFDAVLYIKFQDCENGAGVGCNDDFNRNRNVSQLAFTPVEDGTYFLIVDGVGGGAEGDFVIMAEPGRCPAE